MVVFDEKKRPECLRILICRATGLSIFQRPEWSKIKVGKNYWADYSLVGERILLSQPSGYVNLQSHLGALSLKDKVAAEIGQGKGAYIQIEDYSRLEGASLEARQAFISHVKNNQRLAGLIFYGVSPLLRMSVKLGKRFNIANFDIKIAENYFEALNLALKILTHHNIDPGATFANLKTQTLPLTKEPEKLSILTCPDWELELDGYALRFEVIDGTILHSISKGFLKETHIEAVERTRRDVIKTVSPEKGFEYLVANVKDLGGGNRRARRLYMDSLKNWFNNNPLKMYIFYGVNSFTRAAAYLGKPFMPFKVELADDLNHVLEIIAKDRLRESTLHASQETPRSCEAPFDSNQIQRCAEELIEYIGTINWEDPGGDNKFTIHPNHPFQPVFEAIQLIKGELDDLFSERRRAEKEKEKLEDQLRQAHKMQAIGTLAGGIAHNFNNILSIILGNTELAMEDVLQSNPAQEYLNEIKVASLRARDAVRQLLSFSHKSEQNLEPMKIDALVTETLQFLRSLISATIDIQKNILPEARPILADPVQIKQVLIHLCTNAAHAMEERGGILGIDLRNIELSSVRLTIE